MAKKRSSISKSDMIRQIKAANPEIGPTEIAQRIHQEHGVKVTAAMVSTVLSQDRSRGGKPAKRGRPPKGTSTATSSATTKGKAGRKPAAASADTSIESLVRIKKLADEIGGIEAAKKALDALSKILG